VNDRGTVGARLAEELDQATLHERRGALRALLRSPLLAADAPGFALVRRHAGWLREWLARNAGWSLLVSSELARLRKVPADLGDGTRPAVDAKSKTPFSRRRYVLLCLALAALEAADRQTTLGWLAGKVLTFAAADPELAAAGLEFDMSSRDQRRDLVQVVRLLLDLQVLARVDGDELLYVHDARRDVLYNVHRPALAAVLNVRRGPSTVDAEGFEERLAAIVEEPVPDTEEAKNRRLRSRLTRRLLDDPVMEYADLDEEELAYLQSQRAFLVARVQEATGLVPEMRREGVAMVDERGDLTDLGMPEEGTDGHLTLLLAEFLVAEHERKGGDGAAVGWAAVERRTAELVEEHKDLWRRDVTDPGAEKRLAAEAMERLEALRLVRRTADGVLPRPALSRYALAEPRVPPSRSLLDLLREGS
jgi:uncharacterized protein (TIGR02678 family)